MQATKFWQEDVLQKKRVKETTETQVCEFAGEKVGLNVQAKTCKIL
jgi:hypothetical protein